MNILDSIKKGECDITDLLEHVTDNDYEIAIAVAESPMATAPILDIASRDKDRRVRLAALMNPNIGHTTIEYLSNDQDIEISKKARELLDTYGDQL